MSANYKIVFLITLLSVFYSSQLLAVGELISETAENVGKKVGNAVGTKAGEVTKTVGNKAGVGLTAAEIEHNANAALDKLLKTTPAATELTKTAKAILVFPKILKVGLMVGGQHGEGALKKNGKTVAYYNTVAGSYGFQAGAQAFSFALFFMDDKALDYLNNKDGWEVGVGPSVVLVDEGIAKSVTSMTANESVYVFTFNQGGLMAGAGIQGSKITQIHPE